MSVSLAKLDLEVENFSKLLSSTNQIDVSIKNIEHGELLTSIDLEYGSSTLECIITKEAATRLEIKIGEKILALIKGNEISIFEVLDD